MELIDAKKEGDSKTILDQQEFVDKKGLSYREFNLKSAELIRSQIGNIEEVRKRLGLSKRKICQLLLIDPSTWTRWTTGKTTPPPHIYRTLQWGLALMEKHPETHPLAQYEKFEQLQKIQKLEEKLNQLLETQGRDLAPRTEAPKNNPQKTLLAIFIASALFLALIWQVFK